MNKKRVFYVALYCSDNLKYSRSYSISAAGKIEYILQALSEMNYETTVVSPSYLLEKKWCFDGSKSIILKNKSKLKLFASFGYKTLFGKYLSILFSLINLFFYLLFNVNKNDTVLIYHAVWYTMPVIWASKIRKFNLILEIEEIYAHAFNRGERQLARELNYIEKFDKYLVVNDILPVKLSEIRGKQYAISYGPCYKNDNNALLSFGDDKIHLVYAGSFNKRKFGAQMAVEAAQFLSNKYVLHVLGFGDSETTAELVERIDLLNMTSDCQIKYEGVKRGEEFYQFIKKCDIGLCVQTMSCDIGLHTQTMSCDYTYAFPSKVLAYMSFGLNVICSPLEPLKVSSIDSYLTYSNDDSAQNLAYVIENINLKTKNEIREVVDKLHSEFMIGIKELIEK